jgi:hypothetical protein
LKSPLGRQAVAVHAQFRANEGHAASLLQARDGYFWRTVTRKRGSTADALDPRIVRIKFTPVILEKNSAETIENLSGKRPFATLVCGNLPRSDTIAA